MNEIELSFLGIQPIHIEHDLYTKLLNNKVSFQSITKYLKKFKQDETSLPWLKKYNLLNNSFHTLKEIPLTDVKIESLKFDLAQKTFIPYNAKNQTLHLLPFLNIADTTVALYYDVKFSYFILVYELHFKINISTLENFLDYSSTHDNQNKNDLYNTIRNLIVKETNDSILGSWGNSIQNKTMEEIETFIKDIYRITIQKGDIKIPPSTCNISCFIMDTNGYQKSLIPKLTELNNFAERVPANTPISGFYNNSVYYSFHGRFHTIYLTKYQDRFRFQPLQFHIQYMWFLLERYNHFMNEINLKLMQNDSVKNLQKHAQIIHLMINKIELLSLHDNNFKHSIEIDYQTIYSDNEKRWSLPTLLQSSQRYINFFKDYLDRIFRQKNALSQKRQNNILLSISILQLVALISVWNDYLTLTNISNFKINENILNLFGSSKKLEIFNLYTPTFILIIIFLIFIYLYVRKK